MFSYVYFLSLFSFFVFFVSLGLQYKHLLCILLSLEGMMMSSFIMLLSQMAKGSFFCETSLILITYTACEATLGLSILVYMIRTKGNDYVSSLSTQKC